MPLIRIWTYSNLPIHSANAELQLTALDDVRINHDRFAVLNLENRRHIGDGLAYVVERQRPEERVEPAFDKSLTNLVAIDGSRSFDRHLQHDTDRASGGSCEIRQH